jgi:hypothetical protein
LRLVRKITGSFQRFSERFHGDTSKSICEQIQQLRKVIGVFFFCASESPDIQKILIAQRQNSAGLEFFMIHFSDYRPRFYVCLWVY